MTTRLGGGGLGSGRIGSIQPRKRVAVLVGGVLLALRGIEFLPVSTHMVNPWKYC